MTTSSFSFNLITLTPAATLPIGLIFLLSKCIDIPHLVIIRISSSLINSTFTIESPSLILIAAIPVLRLIFVYSSRRVFFIKPCLVKKTTYFDVLLLAREVIAITSSSESILINVPTCVPFAILVPTGTSSTKILNILPFLVKRSKLSIVLVEMVDIITSSFVFTPFPFLRCTLKDF